MMRATGTFVVIAGIMAAHAACTPPSPEPKAGTATPRTKLTKLLHKVKDSDVPVPLVHMTVAGEQTLAFVDTGAETHVVFAWLAKKLNMPAASAIQITWDAGGRTIDAATVDHPALNVEGGGRSMIVPRC